jgi:hypothetical protein
MRQLGSKMVSLFLISPGGKIASGPTYTLQELVHDIAGVLVQASQRLESLQLVVKSEHDDLFSLVLADAHSIVGGSCFELPRLRYLVPGSRIEPSLLAKLLVTSPSLRHLKLDKVSQKDVAFELPSLPLLDHL